MISMNWGYEDPLQPSLLSSGYFYFLSYGQLYLKFTMTHLDFHMWRWPNFFFQRWPNLQEANEKLILLLSPSQLNLFFQKCFNIFEQYIYIYFFFKSVQIYTKNAVSAEWKEKSDLYFSSYGHFCSQFFIHFSR